MSRYDTKDDFFDIFNAICNINMIKPKTLTQTQFTLLMVILSHINKDSKEAFPGQETIRKKCGIASDTTYYKALNPLIKQGWIIQRKRFNNTCCYKVQIPNDIYQLLVSTENDNLVSTENDNKVSTDSDNLVSIEPVDLTTNINNLYLTTYKNNKYNEAIPDGIVNKMDDNKMPINNVCNDIDYISLQENCNLTTNSVPNGTEDKDNNNVNDNEINDKIFNDYYKKFTDDEVYNEISIRGSIITNILKLANVKRTESAETNINNFISMYEDLRFYMYNDLLHNRDAYQFPEYGLNQRKEKLNAIKKMLVKRASAHRNN